MFLQRQVESYVRRFEGNHIPKPVFCGVCRRGKRLRWHGFYHRSLIGPAQTFILPIRRIFCVVCRHTFSLLPAFAVKFHRYAKEILRFALEKLKSESYEKAADRLMEKMERYVAAMTPYFWRRKFASTLP